MQNMNNLFFLVIGAFKPTKINSCHTLPLKTVAELIFKPIRAQIISM